MLQFIMPIEAMWSKLHWNCSQFEYKKLISIVPMIDLILSTLVGRKKIN